MQTLEEKENHRRAKNARIPENWTKHSFQVRKSLLAEFLDAADTLGIKKYQALEEALSKFLYEHRQIIQQIKQIKAGR